MERIGASMRGKIFWRTLFLLLLILLVVHIAQSPGQTPLDKGLNKVENQQLHDGLSAARKAAGQPAAQTCLLWVIGIWCLFGRRISRGLVPLFVTKITCPGCRAKLNPVAVWGCACGFNDHRERNVLTKHCPMCGALTSHFNCPRCNCTILLW